MKAVVIAKSFTKGGAATGATNLSRALRAAGIEVVEIDATIEGRRNGRIVFRLVERMAEKLFFGDECHCLKFGPANVDLHALEAREQPDIFQFCDISGNTVSFRQASMVRTPVVHRLSDFWPYGGPYHYATGCGPKTLRERVAGWFLRLLVNPGGAVPDLLVAPSHWLADRTRSTVRDRAEVTVIRNATEPRGAHYVRRERSQPSRLRLGFISGKVLDQRKGFDLLPSFLEEAVREGLNVSLGVFGRIAKPPRTLPRGCKIQFHGAFSRRETDAVFDRMDILLCPSRLDTSPNVVCEAMARGIPVVGQIGTGMESYIEDGLNGYLVDFADDSGKGRSSFVAVLRRILKHYDSLSEQAIEAVDRDLAYEPVGRRYAEAYARICDPSQPS